MHRVGVAAYSDIIADISLGYGLAKFRGVAAYSDIIADIVLGYGLAKFRGVAYLG